MHEEIPERIDYRTSCDPVQAFSCHRLPAIAPGEGLPSCRPQHGFRDASNRPIEQCMSVVEQLRGRNVEFFTVQNALIPGGITRKIFMMSHPAKTLVGRDSTTCTASVQRKAATAWLARSQVQPCPQIGRIRIFGIQPFKLTFCLRLAAHAFEEHGAIQTDLEQQCFWPIFLAAGR
jgi:hypothetical protein